jgi:hypothetical protein
VRRHVEILDEQKDAVGVFGHAMGFQYVATSNGASNGGGPVIKLVSDPPGNRVDYLFEHAITRLFYFFFEASRASYYCVYRTEILLRAMRVAERYGVLSARGKDGVADSLCDSRCYYLGDLIVGAVPLIWGKKLNSGMPYCAYEIGQSFDRKEVSESLGVPPRVSHYMLPLDPEFKFAERGAGFVDALVSECETALPDMDSSGLREFFAHQLMVFLGSQAVTKNWIGRYNTLLRQLRVNPQLLNTVTQQTKRLYGPIRVGGFSEADFTPRDRLENSLVDFRFALDEILTYYRADVVSMVEVPEGVQEEVAKACYSRMRPVPYGMRGSTTRPVRSGHTAPEVLAMVDCEEEVGVRTTGIKWDVRRTLFSVFGRRNR